MRRPEKSLNILAAEESQTRDTGTFWYTLALTSPTGLHNFFYDRIKPTFFKHSVDDFIAIMLFY